MSRVPRACLLHSMMHMRSDILCFRRSSVLASGLGWAQPLSGKVLGTQLKQLGTAHPALRRDASEEGQGVGKADGASMAQQLAEVVPQLYR